MDVPKEKWKLAILGVKGGYLITSRSIFPHSKNIPYISIFFKIEECKFLSETDMEYTCYQKALRHGKVLAKLFDVPFQDTRIEQNTLKWIRDV